MHDYLLPTVALALTAFVSGQQAPATPATESSLSIAGGKVAVRFFPVPLPAIPLDEHQKPGTVWSIGDREAAILDTEVALVSGKTLIPPGRWRLSTWFKKKGRRDQKNEWRLLVFQGPANYKSGTTYRELSLQERELPKPATEMLKVEVVESRRVVRLQLFAGKTRLRVTLEPLKVVKHEGTLAGEPALFEFYTWHADYRVQNRLRNLELVPFGRVRREGEFGAVYDISCKSDGNGIFVICHSDSLKTHRELLAARSKALHANPGDAALKSEVAALEKAVREQSTLQSNVMLPGTVEKVKKKAGELKVEPVLDSDGTSFELSFGIRKAKFTLNEKQFKKLDWK